MSQVSLLGEVMPRDTYQLDSDDYDSDAELDLVDDDEYNHLAEEAENGFTEEEVDRMLARLKERGLVAFLRDYLQPNQAGETASLRRLLLGFGIIPPEPLRDPATHNVYLLPFAKIALSRILRRRIKLPQYNTVDDAIQLLGNAKNIIVLSGAGISTSCGIPDFRSSTGLYAQLQQEAKYELDDPQQMFDLHYFREHPEVFYSFAKHIYPKNFTPSPCHRWIKLLEDRGVLLRNYTQNIDTLESMAGVTKVLQCHGSFRTASCLRCKIQVPGQAIEPYIFSSQIPYCDSCCKERDTQRIAARRHTAPRRTTKGPARSKGWGSSSDSGESEADEWDGGEPGIMKPDITFFGQALDSEFDDHLFHDREQVDLLVIIGTSLKVAPVSEVLTHIPHSVPQIFINLTPISHSQPDICLIGDADTIVTYLAYKLGWDFPSPTTASSAREVSIRQIDENQLRPHTVPIQTRPEDVAWVSGVGEVSHVHFLTLKQGSWLRDTVPPAAVEAETVPSFASDKMKGGHGAEDDSDSPPPAKRIKDRESSKLVEILTDRYIGPTGEYSDLLYYESHGEVRELLFSLL